MNSKLAQKIWFSFICRFLLWCFLWEIISQLCFYVLATDPRHPSRFLTVANLIASVLVFGFTSYSALKAALNYHFKSGVADA